MKKLTTLIFTIFLSSFQFINAQEYHPLIEEGKAWDDITCWQCGACPNSARRYFYAGEDTVIDNLKYCKIGSYLIKSQSESEICPPYYVDTVPIPYYELLHEDTLTKKVYILIPGMQNGLLYDFSLQIGDTFVSEWVTFGAPKIVEKIDTVLLLNGEMRKRWSFDPWSELTYIEGIGMETGFFGDFVQFEWWSELMCVQIDGEQVWDGNSYWGGCYGLVGEDEIRSNDLQIYPNPASDFIRITTPKNFDKAKVMIFNSMGQLVLEDKIQTENTIIDVSGFERGIYFVLVETEDGVLKEKLIIR